MALPPISHHGGLPPTGLRGPFEAQGWHYRRSLASRVALLTTIVVGLSVAVMAVATFVTVRMAMQAALDESLLDRATKAADAGAIAELQLQMPPWMYGAADVRIAVITADGQIRSLDRGTPQLALGDPELEVAQGSAEQSVRTIRAGDQRYRIVTVPAGADQALILAQSLEGQDLVLAKLGITMLVAGGLGVLAAALAGWGVARNGLRPVRRLTVAVEHIARTEDLRPLQVEGDDELARLATAFNSMLMALAASRDRQRRLVADAGHELRTPLTRCAPTSTSWPRSTRPRAGCRPRRGPSCSKTCAPRSRSSPPSSVTWSSWRATSRSPTWSRRSTSSTCSIAR